MLLVSFGKDIMNRTHEEIPNFAELIKKENSNFVGFSSNRIRTKSTNSFVSNVMIFG